MPKNKVTKMVLFLLGLTTIIGNPAPATAQKRHYAIEKFKSSDVPLKILKVDNLKSVDFPSGLEIEVQNISSKPIYFIRLGVFFPEVLGDNGNSYVISLKYGNRKLIDINNSPALEDVPIQPGKTHVLKVPTERADGFKAFVKKRNIPTNKTLSISLRIDTINFGDGTGFEAGGSPYHRRASAVYQPLESKSREVFSMKIGFMPNLPVARVSLPRACQDCEGIINCGRWKIIHDPNTHFCVGAGDLICEYDASEIDSERPCTRLRQHPGWCTFATYCPDDYLDEVC